MEPAVYLPARKGGRHLQDMDGMTYALSKRRDNKTYYFCTQRNSLKCPATAIVDNQSEIIVAKSGSHMHDSNLMKQMVREMDQNNAATNPNTSRNCARSERREELRYLVGSFNNVSLKVYMTSLVDFFNG